MRLPPLCAALSLYCITDSSISLLKKRTKKGKISYVKKCDSFYRFRVRDIPGVVQDHAFDTKEFGGLRNIVFESTDDHIKISYGHEHAEKSGYKHNEVIQSKFHTEVTIDTKDFGINYDVDGNQRLAIPQGSLVFETSKDKVVLEILLEKAKQESLQTEDYDRLIGSTEESYEFKGYVESIPNGAAALGLTFEFFKHPDTNFTPKLMGIGHRILNTLDLQATVDHETKERYVEPHRVYNTDHFNDAYTNVGQYGNVPLLYTIENGISTGVIVLNSCDTLVDIQDKSENRLVEWTLETGVVDLYIFTSRSIEANSKKIVEFSGSPPLPMETALGYNQCRWNYFTQDEAEDLNEKLIEHKIPCDTIWLDIEHTNSKIYFTVDTEAFPDLPGFHEMLLKCDRQMVTQVDPHFKDSRQAEKDEKRKIEALAKLDFHNEVSDILTEEEKKQMEQRVHEAHNHYLAPEVIKNKLAVFDTNGDDFVGDCWPGSSIYIDYFNHKAQKYFGDQFIREDHIQKSPYIQIKLDMNEPSVFDPVLECTMPKNNIHTVSHYESTESKEIVVDKFEHRDVHSLYGILMHKCTYEACSTRQVNLTGEDKASRSFVLTRSYYLGSQKYGAMWIGDSSCKWEHLKLYIPMTTTIALSGISFTGVDTPGFFGDPTPDMCVRGYQIGCLFPFFRAHSDRKTQRREPYLFEAPYKQAMIRAVETRYELIMYYYTAFFKYRICNQAVLSPVIDFENGKVIDDQVYIGDSLMAKAITDPDVEKATVFLPNNGPDSVWYRRHGSEQMEGGSNVEIDVKITEESEVPIFVKDGSIIPEHYDICKNG